MQTVEKNKCINWYELFPKKLSIEDIKSVLKAFGISIPVFESKSFKQNKENYEYFYNNEAGISLSFKDQLFNSVFLYGPYDKKFKSWSHKLPFSITFEMNNVDIISFFGEPTIKSGGKTIPISLSYEFLGIEITFISGSWEMLDNKINFICIFEPNNSIEMLFCAVCRKQTTSKCGQCKLIFYCGRDCQTKHWKVHKKYCENYIQDLKESSK